MKKASTAAVLGALIALLIGCNTSPDSDIDQEQGACLSHCVAVSIVVQPLRDIDAPKTVVPTLEATVPLL
jgi:hypothetical protein